MTIGMVVVAFIVASVIGLNPVTMMSTPRPDQVCRKRGQPFHLAVCEAVLDDDILADAVAEAPQTLFKRFNKAERSRPERDREEPHPIDPPCQLLRSGRERPRRYRATEKRDEISTSHVAPVSLS